MGVDLTVYSVHYCNLYTMCTTHIGSCKKKPRAFGRTGGNRKDRIHQFLTC